MDNDVARLKKERQRLARIKYLKELSNEFTPDQAERLEQKLGSVDSAIAKRVDEANKELRSGSANLGSDRDIMKLKSGKEFTGDIAKKRALRSLGGRALKAVPFLGGIASAISSGDASAAVPILGEADELGPGKDTLEGRLERGEMLSAEEMQQLKDKFKK